jgi:hypothetical protein
LELRLPSHSGIGIGLGSGAVKGLATSRPTSTPPADTGRLLWGLLQTSCRQAMMRFFASMAASSTVTMAGLSGSQPNSCSRIRCSRTGRPGRAMAMRGFRRRVVGAVLAAGAFHMDGMHPLHR